MNKAEHHAGAYAAYNEVLQYLDSIGTVTIRIDSLKRAVLSMKPKSIEHSINKLQIYHGKFVDVKELYQALRIRPIPRRD